MDNLLDFLGEAWLDLLGQFGGVTALAWTCTELIPEWGGWKKLMAVVFAMLWSYAGWLMGMIVLPELIHTCEGVSMCGHQYFVLSMCALVSAALAVGGHHVIGQKVSKKLRKKKLGKLPQ